MCAARAIWLAEGYIPLDNPVWLNYCLTNLGKCLREKGDSNETNSDNPDILLVRDNLYSHQVVGACFPLEERMWIMSVLLIYGLMAVVPGLLLFLMGVFGADADADADIDVGADVDVDIDTGDFGGPGALSLKLILFFFVGFGVSGYLSAYFKWPLHHTLWGLVGGCVAWLIGYQLLKLLYKQQSTSQIRLISFVGKQGRVVVPIPKDGGTGEIEATNKETGQSAYFNARATDPQKEYKRGEFVIIKSVAGKTAVVE